MAAYALPGGRTKNWKRRNNSEVGEETTKSGSEVQGSREREWLKSSVSGINTPRLPLSCL